jgi:BirA family biotin operon repressor/biotin-[acetyl-CoA-carboxylase] ligase
MIPATHFETIDSTNAEALRRMCGGLHAPHWFIAERQTAGRGRSGRAWASEPGNFYGSLVWPLTAPPAVAPQVSLIAGLAVHDALTAAAGLTIPGLQLKWPNDVLVGASKLGGILVESTMDQATGQLIAVIGIGLNLAWSPSDIGRAVTSLANEGVTLTPAQVLPRLSEAILARHAVWADGRHFDPLRHAWLASATPVGTAMSINTGAGPVTGTFAGLASDGALQLRTPDGQLTQFSFGDVTLVAR